MEEHTQQVVVQGAEKDVQTVEDEQVQELKNGNQWELLLDQRDHDCEGWPQGASCALGQRLTEVPLELSHYIN